VIDAALCELEPLTSAKTACRLLGKSRATLYRQRNPVPPPERQPGVRAPHPAALSPAERDTLLAALNADRLADKSPAQAWAILLDEGIYLASISTMYRVLRGEGQVRERRAQAAHPPRARPELMADGPDQVWSWDITKLKGPWRGIWLDLYVMLDIFSRKAMRWEVHATENAALATAFIENAITANHGVAPRFVHAGRGTSMTSKPVAALLADLHIIQSHSRPRVSNDNPYSEAQFKTLKYCPAFPGRFGSLHDALAFCDAFFTYYNNEHRHSGIGLYTPASVHDGTATAVQARRQQTLDEAYAASPGRFHHRRPLAPPLPVRVWINQPPATLQTEVTPQTNLVA
jgi:putative transposase